MTRSITYSLIDPTGNITLLVETPVPVEVQPAVARQLMALEPATEQVGFVTCAEDGVSLRMAAGEFCGNATMSAAALYMQNSRKTEAVVCVRVCGTGCVQVHMTAVPGDVWKGTVTMPQPLSVGRECMPDGRKLPVVRFPGLAHVILEKEIEPSEAEFLAADWCQKMDTAALGLMFLNRETSSLKPLVYVPAAGTLFWETSCASGTTAVGAFLAAEVDKSISLSLSQPGGTLEIFADPIGPLLLSGKVRILHRTTDITVTMT